MINSYRLLLINIDYCKYHSDAIDHIQMITVTFNTAYNNSITHVHSVHFVYVPSSLNIDDPLILNTEFT